MSSKSTKTCSVPGCAAQHNAKGFCGSHYMRFRRYGNPLAGGTQNGLPALAIEAAIASATDACILWPFSMDSNGYGQISINCRPLKTHRVVLERMIGPCPPKLEARHLCGVRACVNPRHLAWGTSAENDADKLMHGTLMRGEACPGSKLTVDHVRDIRQCGAMGETHAAIARTHRIARTTVSKILARKAWSWLE